MRFKYQRNIITLFFVAITALTSCECDDDQEYSMSNQGFVTRASNSSNFKIAAGELAKNKAQNTEIKLHAERLVNNHTGACLDLKNLATQKDWPISKKLEQKEQGHLEKLTGVSGDAFDKEFARIMVQSHQDAVALFETGAGTGLSDANLRAWAALRLPALKIHLQQAIELSAAVNP